MILWLTVRGERGRERRGGGGEGGEGGERSLYSILYTIVLKLEIVTSVHICVPVSDWS